MPPGQPPYQIQVAQINAQSASMVQYMKGHSDATIAQLRAEAEAAKTYFTEKQENMRVVHEGMLRAVSEATDRMHELRLEKAKPAA